MAATSSSGLPVTLRVDSGPAVLANGIITVNEVGIVMVVAEQAGDATYAPARVTRGFNVRQALMTRVGGYNTSGSAMGVRVVGNYAYVADGYAGLQVIRVSDPASPVRVGGFKKSDQAYNVQVVGNYAYVAEGDAGLQVIDVSDPANLVRVGGYDGYFGDVQVVENYAYVAKYVGVETGLHVIDVTAPANPVLAGAIGTSGTPKGVQVVGNYAYVADGDAGLQVIRVSLPARPVWVGGVDTSGNAVGVQVVGNYAYVADYNEGLQVIDVSVPANPVRVGGYDTSGTARGVQVVGNYAYVADGDAGLQVIDVRDPAMLVRVGGYDTSGAAVGVHVVGNYAYVADYYEGLQILEIRLGYPQTLELQLSSEVSFDAPVGLVGAANSGLPLTLSVVSGPATVVNNQLVWTGLGPVTLRADQAGDAFFLPASAEWAVTVTLPRLGVRLADGSVEVYWSAGLAGLQLQGRESLSPDSAWQEVTTPPVESDGEARVLLDESLSPRYLRLLKP